MSSSNNKEQKCSEPSLTGMSLGNIIKDRLNKLGLNILDCVGVSTDGRPVMVSDDVGAVKEIQDDAINATYSSC